MSGGSYNYAYRHVEEFASDLRDKGSCSAAPPEIRRAFAAHCAKVAQAMHACEWNDSCDGDDNEQELILSCLKRTPAEVEAESTLAAIRDGVIGLRAALDRFSPSSPASAKGEEDRPKYEYECYSRQDGEMQRDPKWEASMNASPPPAGAEEVAQEMERIEGSTGSAHAARLALLAAFGERVRAEERRKTLEEVDAALEVALQRVIKSHHPSDDTQVMTGIEEAQDVVRSLSRAGSGPQDDKGARHG